MSAKQTPGSAELNPELEAWLTSAREAEAQAPPELGTMLSAVEAQIAQAEKRPMFWLRSRPTLVRILAFMTAAGVAAYAAVYLRADFGRYPSVPMALALGALAFLIGMSVHHALRPLHQPPIPPWARFGLAGLTVAATLLLALLPPDVPDPVPEARTFLVHARSCVIYGVLSGVPVYLIVRLLDRTRGSGAILAACAAGLLGDLALQLRCACNEPEHLIFGHFSVVALFVGGLGAIHALLRNRT